MKRKTPADNERFHAICNVNFLTCFDTGGI